MALSIPRYTAKLPTPTSTLSSGKNEDRVHCKDPDQDIGGSYHSMKVPELIKDKFVEEALAGTFRREMLLASELYRDHIVQSLEDAVLMRN